ncbi:MAG: lysophospholipid acyltransferase family protein, partial [Phycisphaerales bacterium]|nr:lysophospholipid acyltransferase family protein [Phycisphaerales bacterium]
VEAYRHLFTLAVELAVAPRMLAVDAYAAHVELGDLRDGLQRLLTGRPAVLVTGHCGNWELLGTVLATLGFPMYALYRPLDVKALDRWVLRTRSATGMTLVDKFGGMSAMPRIMGEGGAVGFIADQNAGDRGMFVPFFDRLASAYKSVGVMAMHYNAPVICGRARRLTGSFDPETSDDALDELLRADAPLFRYRVDITEIITPEEWSQQPDPLFYITARYRRAIEQMVRDAPEQYLWMHRYWKSRPRHERFGEPFPPRLRDKIAALPWMTPDELDRIVERSARDAHDHAHSKRR